MKACMKFLIKIKFSKFLYLLLKETILSVRIAMKNGRLGEVLQALYKMTMRPYYTIEKSSSSLNLYDIKSLSNLTKFFSQIFAALAVLPVHIISLFRHSSVPVCESPTHIEAREVETQLSWIDSKSFLVHDSNSTTALFADVLNPYPSWAYGISKDSG